MERTIGHGIQVKGGMLKTTTLNVRSAIKEDTKGGETVKERSVSMILLAGGTGKRMGNLSCKLSTVSSISNTEESFFLQASLDNLLERRNSGESTMSSYYLKSTTPGTFEAALMQKEGELSSYMSRLATMKSIRDSLAKKLFKMTEQCEKLRTEASMLPSIRAELEALRRRHATLELMGEHDE